MPQPDPPAQGRVPRATYRLQMSRALTFRDAEGLAPYLAALGVSDVYTSPYLQARPGSGHGYDITRHAALDPEVGSDDDHARMSAAFRSHGLGHLLDVVPNHMGIGGDDNPWWWDVLENGRASPHAAVFDVDWHPLTPGLEGRILLPVLGDRYGAVLERGELELLHDAGRFRVRYHEHVFPVAPRSSAAVLREALDLLADRLPDEHPDRMELESVVTALERLPPREADDAASVAERRREKRVAERRLSALGRDSAEVRGALDEAVRRFNGTPGDPRSFDRLDAMLDEQAYRLAFWRVAAEEINYRRFFDINDLAGVRVELPAVFDATHELVLRLVEEGRVTGLRIDHPDGLYDPRGYLRRLQDEAAARGVSPLPVWVEKILTGGEELPADWPVEGTVGYEFLNQVGGLWVDPDAEAEMDRAWRRFAGDVPAWDALVAERKRQVLRVALVSELRVLADLAKRIAASDRATRDLTLGSLRDAIRETAVAFPVYRTYVEADAGRVSDSDRLYVERAVRLAKRRNRGTSALVFDFVRDLLLLEWPDGRSAEDVAARARFAMKFQQLTGPVMAKGVEDTAFYVFDRLVALNEVGGEPARFGVEPAAFHAFCRERAARRPRALSCTSTHDTKRSEDVRARIAVLSEIPDLWSEAAGRWRDADSAFRREDEDGQPVPDPNDEYLLYQTLVGVWPLDEPEDDDGWETLVGRVAAYMEKATREAKTHTSWINPHPAYDDGLRGFVEDVLRRRPSNAFLDDLRRVQRIVAPFGMLNSLAQLLVKLTAPGVPDVYQGQELWDFSLVDPDNRRPVDWELRRRLLHEVETRLQEDGPSVVAADLLASWRDGRIKMYVTRQGLHLRAARPALFDGGDHVALDAAGPASRHLVAFARVHENERAITVVPRLAARMMRERDFALPDADAWTGTRIEAPADVLSGRWRCVLSGVEVGARDGDDGRASLDAAALLGSFPLALLEPMG